jgi:hypothetical protein
VLKDIVVRKRGRPESRHVARDPPLVHPEACTRWLNIAGLILQLNHPPPDLAPERERLRELGLHLRPRLRAPACVEHCAEQAIDAEPGVPEAGVGVVHLPLAHAGHGAWHAMEGSDKRRAILLDNTHSTWSAFHASAGIFGVVYEISEAFRLIFFEHTFVSKASRKLQSFSDFF